MSVPQFEPKTEFVVDYEPHLDISGTEYPIDKLNK